MTEIRLWPHQIAALDQLERADWTGLVTHGVGRGKTATALEAARRSGSLDGTVLIVAPMRTRAGWDRALRAIAPEHGLRIISSGDAGRRVWNALCAGDQGVYFIHYELLARWGKIPPKSQEKVLGGALVDMLILDEVHRVSNATRTAVAHNIVRRIRRRHCIGLSATPAGNNPSRIYGTLRAINPAQIGGKVKFLDKYFKKVFDPFSPAGFHYTTEIRPGSVIADQGDSWVADPGGDTALPVIEEHIPVRLTSAQKKAYSQWETTAIAWLEDNPSAVELPATLDLRLRQLTLGEMIVDDTGAPGYAPDCRSPKIRALLDLLSDLGDEPVVVYTHSKKFLKPLLSQLREAGYDAVSVSSDDKKSWEEFRDGKHQILCAVIPAIAEGVDGLQRRAHIEVWLSQDNSLNLNRQAEGRLLRAGQGHTVVRYRIEAPGTIDTETVSPRLAQRESDLAISGLI